MSSLLRLSDNNQVNLSDYYKKAHIDTNFNLAFENDLKLANRADQKFEFTIPRTETPSLSRILRIGSITYDRNQWQEGKMANIRICLSQDKARNFDFYLLIMFKLTNYGLRDFDGQEFFYGNCQYYIFGDGSTYTYPKLEISQVYETVQVTDCLKIMWYIHSFQTHNIILLQIAETVLSKLTDTRLLSFLIQL